jgi:hypothetical protein
MIQALGSIIHEGQPATEAASEIQNTPYTESGCILRVCQRG